MRMYRNGDGKAEYGYSPALSHGEWHHVFAVWNGRYRSLFIDGQAVVDGEDNWENIQEQKDRALAIGGAVNDDCYVCNSPVSAAVLFDAYAGAALPGVIRITRAGTAAAIAEAVEIAYTVGGSAVAGEDYEPLAGSVTIPAGAAFTDLVVRPCEGGSGTLAVTLTPATVPVNASARRIELSIHSRNARVKETIVRFTVRGYTGAAVADFPVLVRLNEGVGGFSYGLMRDPENGGDLYFTDPRGQSLPFDIDTWNPDGESLVWVRMPLLAPGASIFLHCGGVAAANAPHTVWNGLAGVWHARVIDGYLKNAAQENINTGRAWKSGNPYTSAGVVGDGQTISNGNKGEKGGHGWVAGANAVLNVGETFTASVWVRYKAGQAVDYDRILGRKSSYNSGNGWEVSLVRDKPYELDVRSSGADKNCGVRLASPINDGAWHHLVFVFDGATLSAYENGVCVAENASVGAAVVDSENHGITFGNNDNRDECAFKGTLDEIRFGAGSLSADRVRADYETVANVDFFSSSRYVSGFAIIVK